MKRMKNKKYQQGNGMNQFLRTESEEDVLQHVIDGFLLSVMHKHAQT